jgi:hypothetical protein
MTRRLTKLRIDEVSSVDKGAGEGVRIMLMKRDSDNTATINEALEHLAEHISTIVFSKSFTDKPAALGNLFEEFAEYLKANTTYDGDSDIDAGNRAGPTPKPNDLYHQSTLHPVLEEIIQAAMALPATHEGWDAEGKPKVKQSMSMEEAIHWIANTAHGRSFAQFHNSITKRKEETPMNRTDELRDIAKTAGGMAVICKSIIDRGSTTISEHEFSAALMEHCKAHRAGNETVVKAFSRMIEEDSEIRRAYGIAKGYPNLMDIGPTSVEVGSTATADDSKKAYDKLMALCRETAQAGANQNHSAIVRGGVC